MPGTARHADSEVLGERDRAILDFERDWLLRDGHKQRAIRAHFGFSPSRYYALLARVIPRKAAEAHDPLLVRRLRRDRARRTGTRAGLATTTGTGLNEQVGPARRRPASK